MRGPATARDLRWRHSQKYSVLGQRDGGTAVEQDQVAYNAKHGLLFRAFYVGSTDEFRATSEFRLRACRDDLRDRFAAPNQSARIGRETGACLNRHLFAREH